MKISNTEICLVLAMLMLRQRLKRSLGSADSQTELDGPRCNCFVSGKLGNPAGRPRR